MLKTVNIILFILLCSNMSFAQIGLELDAIRSPIHVEKPIIEPIKQTYPTLLEIFSSTNPIVQTPKAYCYDYCLFASCCCTTVITFLAQFLTFLLRAMINLTMIYWLICLFCRHMNNLEKFEFLYSFCFNKSEDCVWPRKKFKAKASINRQ